MCRKVGGAATVKESKPGTQIICSTVCYCFFDTVWSKAIPADQNIYNNR